MERGNESGVVTDFGVVSKALLKDGFGAEFHPTRAPVVDRPLVRRLVFRRRRVFDRLFLDHPVHLPFGIGVERVLFACHGTDEEVVVDIQFLALQDGGQELGSLEERIIACGFFVNLAHDLDSLEVEILRSAPEQFLQRINALVIRRNPCCRTTPKITCGFFCCSFSCCRFRCGLHLLSPIQSIAIS